MVGLGSFRTVYDVIRTTKNPHLFLLSFLRITNAREIHLRNGLVFYGKEWNYLYPIYSVMKEYDNIKELDSKARVIVDIGAHIGSFAVQIAAENSKLKVYAYEPNSINFQYLSKNIKANNLQKRIIAVKKGVSSKKEKLTLYGECASCSAENSQVGKVCEVAETVSFKDIFRDNEIKHIDFLKMDCEGSEYDILKAAPKDLLKSVHHMALEYHEWNGHKLSELTEILESNGFTITKIEGSVPGVGLIHARLDSKTSR